MSSYLTRLMHCILVFIVVIGIMILYVLPDQGVKPELNETYIPTPAPDVYIYHGGQSEPNETCVPTPLPTIVQTPPVPDKIDIRALSMYDRDNDGNLSKHELGVIEYDYLDRVLTSSQMKCAVDVLGYVPGIAPTPTATTEVLPTPDANVSEVSTDTTQDKWSDLEQFRAEVETGVRGNEIGDMAEDFVNFVRRYVGEISNLW